MGRSLRLPNGTRRTASRISSGTSTCISSAAMTSGMKSRRPRSRQWAATFTATAGQDASGSGWVSSAVCRVALSRLRGDSSVAIATGRARMTAPLPARPRESARVGGRCSAAKMSSASRVQIPIPRPSTRDQSSQRMSSSRRSSAPSATHSPRISIMATSSSKGEPGVSCRTMSRTPSGNARAIRSGVPRNSVGTPSALPHACASSAPRARAWSESGGLTITRLRLSLPQPLYLPADERLRGSRRAQRHLVRHR